MPLQHENRSLTDEVVADLLSGSGLPKWKDWGLRPLVLFPAAYTIVGLSHELVHALTAFVLGVPSTLFHLYANIDSDSGTPGQIAEIRAAGPVFCLGFGLVAWIAYRRLITRHLALPLLYLAWFGIVTFFGNLMGTPFVGDFGSLAAALGLAMPVRYATAIVGLVSICGLSFFIGTELRRWSPLGVGSVRAMTVMILTPALLGTAATLLIFQPMPAGWASARLGESVFWVFAAVGTFTSRKQPSDTNLDLGLRWPDVAILLTAVLVVRLFALGIEFTP